MTTVVAEPQVTHSRPSAFRLIHAEFLRIKGSTLQWFPFIGLVIGVVSSTLAFWSSGQHDASGALSWQAMYVTGMAAPLLALMASLAEDREKSNRYGGTNLRPVSPYATRITRIGVLIVFSVLFHLMNFGSAWLLTTLEGREGANALLVAGGLAFVGSIATVGLFSLIARYVSLVPTLLVAVVYQVVGTLLSESPLWVMLPPTWPVRLLLPALGVHSNAVPLAANDPLAHESPLQAIVLNVVFALICVSLAIFVRDPQRKLTKKEITQPRPQENVAAVDFNSNSVNASPDFAVREGRDVLGNALSSFRIVFLSSSISWLMLSVMAVFGLLGLIYPASYVSGFYTFSVLPLGAGLLPVLSWRLLSSTWRISVFENSKMRISYLISHSLVVVVLSVLVGASHLLAGGALPETANLVLLWSTTGILLTTFSTALCVAFGAGATVAWSVFITVIAATLGGDVLAESILWVVALPAWPEIANTPGRLIFAGVAELILFILAARWFFVALRNFERMS